MRQGQINALWCIDSATGREYLIDLDKSTVIAERVNGKIVDPNLSQPEIPNEGC